MEYERQIKKGNTIKYLCISMGLSLVLILCGNSFREPDDYLISAIYAGVYGGGLNRLLIPYINVLYGAICRGLCYVFPEAQIWGIVLLSELGITAFFFHMCFPQLESDNSEVYNTIYHILVILVQISIGYYFFTYTVIAYLLAGSSLMLFGNTSSTKLKVASFLGLILGILLRPQIIASFCLIMITTILSKKEQIRMCIIAAIVILIFSAINGMLFNSSVIWNEYASWNETCTKYRDYRINWEKTDLNSVLIENNWDQNDLDMISNWTFADRIVFSKEKMDKVLNKISVEARYNFDVKRIIISVISDRLFRSSVVVATVCVIILALSQNKKSVIQIFISLMMLLVLFASLYVRKRFVDRIYIPLFLLFSFRVVICVISDKIKGYMKAVVLCLCCIVLLCGCYPLINIRQNEKSQSNVIYHEMARYILESTDSVFVSNSSIVNCIFTNKPIKEITSEDFPQNLIKAGSWDTFSGRYMVQTGGEDSVFRMLLQEHIYYLSADQEEIIRIQTFVNKHYDDTSKYEIVYQIGNIKVYSFTSDKDD